MLGYLSGLIVERLRCEQNACYCADNNFIIRMHFLNKILKDFTESTSEIIFNLNIIPSPHTLINDDYDLNKTTSILTYHNSWFFNWLAKYWNSVTDFQITLYLSYSRVKLNAGPWLPSNAPHDARQGSTSGDVRHARADTITAQLRLHAGSWACSIHASHCRHPTAPIMDWANIPRAGYELIDLTIRAFDHPAFTRPQLDGAAHSHCISPSCWNINYGRLPHERHIISMWNGAKPGAADALVSLIYSDPSVWFMDQESTDQFHKSQNAPVPYPRMLHSIAVVFAQPIEARC